MSASTSKPANGKPGAKPRHILPTDRIAFAKQLELLRAWAAASGPSSKAVTNNEAAAIIKMAPSTISLANPFFADVGLLQRNEGAFVPCADVFAFNHAYQWNPETAATKLGPTLQGTWFYEALHPRLAFGPVAEKDATQALSEHCSAGPDYENQLKTLLEYLAAGGLIVIDNGTIRSCPGPAPSSTGATTTTTTPAPEQREHSTQRTTTVSTSFNKPQQGLMNFHIDFRVDMQEMAGWSADRVTAFFNGIAQVLNAKGSIEEKEAT